MSDWDTRTLDRRDETADVVELDDTADGAVAPVTWPAAAGDIGLPALRQFFDNLPVAVYSVDADGRLTYFNPASVEFAGRLPMLGKDKWCVAWKLYSADGHFIPHDQSPTSLAVKDGRPIRGATVIAERPNGTRVPFTAYPTPIRDGNGRLVGAFNMLVAI